MRTNRWIDLSQRFYRRLLRLYPQAYRTAYESEMFHVFTDQCRDAYRQRGGLGILVLWLRTLADVGKSVVVEHVSDPNAKVGLLEAMPNTPLPWKGVLLVLIPGMIFFVSQVEQLTSDKDWFFYVYYRAAFFLIVPVLFVWFFARRFPVWGLIPFGLLFGTLQSFSPGYLAGKVPFLVHSESMWRVLGFALDPYYFVPVSACLLLLCGLIWHGARTGQFSKSARGWLILCFALVVIQVVVVTQRAYRDEVANGFDWQSIKIFVTQVPFWYLYGSLPFLVLVFVGKLFVRQHRGLSFLLLLGYLLPVIVVGRYGNWSDLVPFSVVVFGVLLYRFVVALVAPVWLVRAASATGRQRAAIIPVAVALFCHVTLNIVFNLALADQYAYPLDVPGLAVTFWDQLIIAAGLGLAVTLYLPGDDEPSVVAFPPEAVAE